MYASKAATLSRSASTTTSRTDAFGRSEPSVFGPARLAHWAGRLMRLNLPFAGRRTLGTRTAALGAGLVVLALAGTAAHAQTAVTLVSNLGQTVDSSSTLSTTDRAQGFTTGSHTGGYVLTEVEVKFATAPDTNVIVRLATGLPSSTTVVATLTNPSTLSSGNLTFTAPADTTLDADTQYWVVIEGGGAGSLSSTITNAEDSGSAAGWSISNSSNSRLSSSTGAWSIGTSERMIAIKGNEAGLPARPAAPTVSAVPLQPDRLAVRWSAPTGAALTDYDVRYYQGSANPTNEADWIEAGETGGHDHVGTLTTATITGLTPVTTYRVQVRATNSAGTGAWSPSGSGRTEALVGAWGSSVLELVGNTSKTVYNSRSLATFDVAQPFRSAGHGLGYTVTDVDLLFSSAPDAGVRVTLATGLSSSSAGTTLATLRNPAALGAGVLTFTAPTGTTLNANTRYFVVVESAAGSLSRTASGAEDGVLGWEISNTDLRRPASSTGGWEFSGSSYMIRINGRENVGDPPGAPDAPTVTAVTGSTGITVGWSAPTHTGSGITDYDVRFYEGSADPANEADWVEEDETTGLPDTFTADASTSETITGLKASTAYRVQVRAESHGAPGPWSDSSSVTTNAGTGTNNAPTRAKLAAVAANGCIADTGNAARGSLSLLNSSLYSVPNITNTSECVVAGPNGRQAPWFIDPDGDDLAVSAEAVIPDNVRFLDGTPLMASDFDSFFVRAVAAGSATDVRVNFVATDPHGESVGSWFNVKVHPPFPNNNRTPRFDEMVGTRGFPVGVPVGRWVLPPANGGEMVSRNEAGQLPYFYAVSGLPPGLSFDPMTRVVAGTPTKAGTYTVTYTADDADAAYSLKASPTAADLADAARQSFVVQIGAPAIEFVQIVSAPTYDANGDGVFDTYIAGDQILVDVQFTEAVQVTGTPVNTGFRVRVALDLGPSGALEHLNRVWANLLEEGGELYGGRRLRFGYTVNGGNGQACSVATTTADCDSDGVWIQTLHRNGTVVHLPSGLSLTSVESGAAAVRTFTGLPTTGAANAKVDGSMTSADVGPRPVSAATDADGNTVTVTFNRALSTQVDLSGVPLPAYFSIRGAGPVGAGQRGVYQHPNTVAVSGSSVVLELNTPARASDTVTLSYELVGPGVWPIKDQSSPPKRVAGWIDLAVTNNSRGVAAPVPASASAVGTALEVVFDQRLDQDSRPSGSAFTVHASNVEGVRRTIAGVDTPVAIDDTKVAVTLTGAVAPGDSLSVYYAKPADSPLRNAASTAAVASFEAFYLEGVYDSTVPKLLSKLANILQNRQSDPPHGKSKILLYYDERLDRTSVPAAGDFALSSDDANAVAGATVASVAVEDTAVVLTTSHWLKDNIDYTLVYTPGTARIQDLAGNAVAAFTETFRSFAVGQPVLRGSTVAGTRLELDMRNPLNPGAVPPPSAFTLWEKDVVAGETELHELSGTRIVSVAVNAWTAILQLSYPVYPCDGERPFRVSYTLPASGDERLQTAAGWGASGWTATKWRGHTDDYALVTNARHGRCAEWLAGTYRGSVVLESERAFARNRGEPEPAWFDVSASGGPVRVTRAAFDPNDPKELKLSLSREFTDDETVTVSYRRPGGASGLWDANGNQLKNVANAQVQEGTPEEPDGLTASFHGLPDTHDGGQLFGFQIRFSEEFRGLTLTKLKRALSVTGGRLVDAKRTVRGENRRVTVRVRPSGIGAMSLALAATTDCTAASAICTSDGRKLSAAVTATVAGPPPVVGVADAHADEGGTLAFSVTLSRAATGQVSVDYATGDGSAAAGADYTGTSGTLTFAAGETAKTVEVALLTDTAAEDDETLTLTLSNARGATIGDGAATGTVSNVVPPPDTTPPAPESAEVNGHIASVTFDEDLAPVGSTSWFNFHWTITGTGVRHHPESAWISGARTVTMRLARDFPAVAGQTVTLIYEPGAFLKDAAGNQVAFFTIVAKNLTLPVLTVSDAQAHEGGEDAALDFVVRLNAGVDDTVTVGYATADGSAKAGEDYTATSGTLTFAPRETEKTVSVRVLDDVVDEGAETLTFRLSNADGARIGDGTATGTITNSDPLQKMILSRIGRTKADHLTRAVSDRLSGPLAGAQVTVGGQTFNLAETKDEARLGETLTSIARALGAVEEPQPRDNDWPGTGLRVREPPTLGSTPEAGVSGRELLLGSAFHVARQGDGGGPGLAAWGRVEVGGFDGEAPADAGNVRIDGNVTTGILGADAEWQSLLAGVAVSVSDGDGTFDQPDVDSGTFETRLTTVSPYARVMLNERVSTWGLVGFGTGDMTIVQAANDRGQPERITRTDLKLRMGAIGGSGALLEASESGGMDLTLKADAFYVETTSEAVSNEGDTTADASRMRLILDGSRPLVMATGGVLTPGLELGLRHDGGDAETGAGIELGGRLSWAHPGSGLSMEARARTLVAHEESGYEEWGASGAVRLATGVSGRGLSFSLTPTWGAPSSGAERLWSARDAGGLAPTGTFEPQSRLEAELGYGLPAFGGRFTGTPNFGLGLSDDARDYRLGWRLTPAAPSGPELEVKLDATRRESEGGAGAAEHGVTLTGALRW